MLRSTTALKALAAICLTLSLTACKTSPQKPAAEAPAICPSTAFVDVTYFEVAPLASKNDKVYHKWVGDNYIAKMPELKIAYSDLLECWNHYHPKENK